MSSRPTPRFIIGKSVANGFTAYTSGDLFERDGELFVLHSGSYGWTLRRTLKCDGYRTDWSAPPLEGWVELPSASAITDKLNRAAGECQ